jgi:hypothetical protein
VTSKNVRQLLYLYNAGKAALFDEIVQQAIELREDVPREIGRWPTKHPERSSASVSVITPSIESRHTCNSTLRRRVAKYASRPNERQRAVRRATAGCPKGE